MALIDRPVRMPSRPEPSTGWYRGRGLGRLCQEQNGLPDYPPLLLQEDNNRILLESA